MHFHNGLATFEHQNYAVVEQFGAENVPVLGGRLVYQKD